MDGMSLQDLIADIEARDPNAIARPGFENPHSYRGYYECLSFEPTESSTAGEMLRAAKSAVGETYEGWKGGDFKMELYTPCFLAERGCCGDPLTKLALRGMFAPITEGGAS